MFKTILLAYDGSDHAQHALELACDMAKTHGAALHVVHTPQHDSPPIVFGPYVSGLGTPPSQKKINEAGEKMVEKARADAKALGVDLAGVHIGKTQPAEFILKTADATHADLIILGRRGLGPVKSIALGSVSQAVAHGAKTACMTVV